MAERGNEVALAIEEQIREAIEKMVGDIRSSVEDVRKAVDQQLDAALQSVQADANTISFRSILQKKLGEFEESIGGVASPAAAPAGADPKRIKRAIQTVEQGKTQVEVLNALLEQSLEFGSRAALLILKGDSFAGWKGAGFAKFGGNDEAVKRFTAAAATIPELDKVLREERVVTVDGDGLAGRLGASAPSRGVLVPMVIKDKIAAVVYVDEMEGDEKRLDQTPLEVLVFTTGLLIDTLAIRKKIPSPTLSAEEGAAPESPARAAAPPPKPAPAPAPVAPPPRPSPPAAPTFGGTIAVPRLDESGARRPAPSAPSFATTAMPAVSAPVAPPPSVRPAQEAGSLGEPADRPSTQYIPPPGLARGAGVHASVTDDSKRHDEARRFARLLVSEIKLYNEGKVEQGRKNRDLYERLKEDIDRSRQMYDERIAEEVRKASNYFYDELVRILADGDPETLGL